MDRPTLGDALANAARSLVALDAESTAALPVA